MDFPPIIPTAIISAEQRATLVSHPVYTVQSTWRHGQALYVKRLNGPLDKPLTLQERWMLADIRLRSGPGAVVAEKPYHSERRRFLIAWTLDDVQSRQAVLPSRRSI